MHKHIRSAMIKALIMTGMALTLSSCSKESVGGVGDDWLAYGGTADEQRFSTLDQINTDSVGRLGLAWSLDLDGETTLEGTPLEVNGVLYFTGQDSSVYAADAVSGKMLWKWESESWKNRPAHLRFLFMANRGLAYWKGKIYVGTLDGRLVALDTKTGKQIWSVKTVADDSRHMISGAPRAFNGKIIIGNGGGDYGTRGYVTAYDAESGKQAWRFFIVPGDPSQPFEQPAMEMAAKTWTGKWWKWGGGGAAWDGMTYDQELNRIYIGTGNSGPYNPRLRTPEGGDNLFLASIVAVDADTGQYIWHYQVSPQEAWDHKATAQITLANLTIDGKPRKVLMQAPSNGFFYVIDRENGKLLSAEKTGKVTWATHVDMKTGRPVETENIRYEKGPVTIWPGAYGSHNWQAMSYSPLTGLVYLPYMQLGTRYETDQAYVDEIKRNGGVPKPGMIGSGTKFSIYADPKDPDDGKGALLAWDPIAQKARWKIPLPVIWNGGTMVTAGNLVFQGDADGNLSAYNAETGKKLWGFNAGLGIIAPPITYTVSGKQYISLLVGWGGASGFPSKYVNRGWKYGVQPRRLLTFTLDGKATLPKTAPPDMTVHAQDDPNLVLDERLVKLGSAVYGNCIMCHGANTISSGAPAPDLRESGIALDYQSFSDFLASGASQERGMPRYTEFTDEQRKALWMYIRAGAREALGKRAAEGDAAVSSN